eukprot:14255617-Alexandrium_andersonii.AAC.1
MDVLGLVLCPTEMRSDFWVLCDGYGRRVLIAGEPRQRAVVARRLKWLARTPRRCRRMFCFVLLYTIKALRHVARFCQRSFLSLCLDSPAWYRSTSGKRAGAEVRRAACEAASKSGSTQCILGLFTCGAVWFLAKHDLGHAAALSLEARRRPSAAVLPATMPRFDT